MDYVKLENPPLYQDHRAILTNNEISTSLLSVKRDTPWVGEMREKQWLRAVWLEMRAQSIPNIPHYEDSVFPKFAQRHGFSPYSPARLARIEAMYAEYAARANEPEPVLAEIIEFPQEPSAEVVDLRLERLRRRGIS